MIVDATPGHKDTRNQTINKIASAFGANEKARLGRFLCAVERARGGKLELQFCDTSNCAIYIKTIEGDYDVRGQALCDLPMELVHLVSSEAYRWWTVDAWHV